MSNLIKEANRIVTPLINSLINNTDGLDNKRIAHLANAILADVHGIQRKVQLTTLTSKGVDAFVTDMQPDSPRLNLNVAYLPELLETIKNAPEERRERWKVLFSNRLRELDVVRDRPVILVDNLKSIPSYQVQIGIVGGQRKVVGVICTYGSSLSTWVKACGLTMSTNEFSNNLSTHYMKDHRNFVAIADGFVQ